MKKSLADQVRDYLAYRGADFTPAKLAAEVAKLQRDLPEGKRCKRQNIEQLLEKGFRTVLYVPALAAAMGTTVETLAAGAFVPGQEESRAEQRNAPPQGRDEQSGDPCPPSDLVLSEYTPTGDGKQARGPDSKTWSVSSDWLRINAPDHTGTKNLFVVVGFGRSMKGSFNPGDPLLLDVGVKSVSHEGIYFFRVGNEGFIQIIQRVPDFDGPGYRLRVLSTNAEYPSYELSPRNPHFEVFGKVLTVLPSSKG